MMEYKTKWYRRLELYCLSLSVICQIVCLTTPGWMILVHGNNQQYSGVFYVTECHRDDCETKSKYVIYDEIVSNSQNVTNLERSERLLLDRDHHRDIEEQVFMLVVLVSTFVVFVLQYYKVKHRHIYLPRLTATTVPFLAIDCGLMMKIIVDDFIEIDYMIERSKSDFRDNRYVGFPYCIVVYIAALLFTMITILLYALEMCKLSQKAPKPPPMKAMEDDYDMNSAPKQKRNDSMISADDVKVSPITERTDSMVSTGFDNKAYDIKL